MATLKQLFSKFIVSLERGPDFDNLNKVRSATSMFYGCYALFRVPEYSFPSMAGTGAGGFLGNCKSIQIVPNIDLGIGYTNNNNFVYNNDTLKRMLTPLRFSFSVANAKMSARALNEMFTILPTVSGQTINITGNYGASTCDKNIAISKGWTVVA